MCVYIYVYIPRPPNGPLSRAIWFLLAGIKGVLRGSWGVLAYLYIYNKQ